MVISLLLILLILPNQASAAGTIDFNQPITMKIEYIYWEGTRQVPVEGAQFDLYFVADVSADGSEYTLTEQFAPYISQITDLDNLNGLNALQRRRLAINLKTLAETKGFTPVDTVRIEENGYAELPTAEGKQLKAGLYLMIGQKCTIDGYTYTASPSIITLPNQDDTTGNWVYDVTVQPKMGRAPAQEDDEKISITVTKKWEDKSDSNRPTEITVHLNNGSEVYETVKLNAENRWTYVWKDLTKGADWSVTEEPVEYYTCSVERNGDTFVITNTLSGNPPDGDDPDNPDDPDGKHDDPSDNPGDSDDGGNGGNGGGSGDSGDSGNRGKLPKTGVLWWPIPCMVILGIAFIIIGIELRKKRNEKSV